ncbi:WG repeat-containing protein [Leptospira kanakyensis]|uniref:WG repeat-containing protein n=1 Tax=Leptospira kanakyensis TaxID=2484968 RepID=A0A6N4QBC1_9LEPT|nr:WG repeat-containing protein [Leptospira kanakyensis]TGK49208.1 WG repeat-containing protein [Leptospira kanakyensis]TGK60550.1 WG repeat-containing protein [Leptospira kanakyensis]TGK67951.1 WG repeat-containing protein [Leptospira kanakyensis]
MKFLLTFLIFFIPLLAKSNLPISFEENGLYGFKNKSGKVIIKPQYQHVMDFTKESVSFVVSDNKWVCIDTKNKILLETFVYDNGPDYYSEKLARFVENGKFGFFDSHCKKQIPASYDFVFPFVNGFSIVCNGCKLQPEDEHSRIVGGKYGAINKTGKLVIPIQYEQIDSIDAKKKTANVTNNKTKITINFK